MGVNRVTIGVQSFDDDHLATLGRAHSADDARAAIAACREGGITNLDLDLMFGLPGQTLASWRSDLAEAVAGQGCWMQSRQVDAEEGRFSINLVK